MPQRKLHFAVRIQIVVRALEEPVRQIAYNAGFDGGVISNKSPFILTHELFNR